MLTPSPAAPRARLGFFLVLAAVTLAPAPARGWGYAVHRLINRNAIANLPADFSLFAQWGGELEQLATAADERKDSDPDEGMRHYIDIDDYPEFLNGTFPHSYDQAVTHFGLGRLESNGIGPWALKESFDRLVVYFAAHDWPNAVATAGDVGHYTGDLHQPLHLTVNFDGDATNQGGIHSRFESRLTGRHMAEFTPLPGAATLIEDPLERTFQWIDQIYPGVVMILAADRSARAEAGGSTSTDVYYNAMWQELGQDMSYWIGEASMDVAALWYTAWVRAGSPALPGSAPVQATTWSAIKGLYATPAAAGLSSTH